MVSAMSCLTCTQILGRCRRDDWELTPREHEVLELVSNGHSNVAASVCLALSERTVQAHVRNLLRKTGTASRTQLAVCAIRRGVLPLGPCGCEPAQPPAGGGPSPDRWR